MDLKEVEEPYYYLFVGDFTMWQVDQAIQHRMVGGNDMEGTALV
jgi:hypothetical protein